MLFHYLIRKIKCLSDRTPLRWIPTTGLHRLSAEMTKRRVNGVDDLLDERRLRLINARIRKHRNRDLPCGQGFVCISQDGESAPTARSERDRT